MESPSDGGATESISVSANSPTPAIDHVAPVAAQRTDGEREQLAQTGSDISQGAALGMAGALVAAGGGALLYSRRRSET